MPGRNDFKAILMTLISMITLASHASERHDVRTPYNRVVYSVYLRNYTNPDVSATFNDLRGDLPRLRDLGIDVIHLLPFYEMGVEHAKGSPYCIRDYEKVDSRYGSADDLKALIADIHANGMEIWFDWVGNHTAYDHRWVKEHPEWYTERQDFDDVRSVNSSNPELRKAMVQCMKYWVDEYGIDGYRCDFAHGPGLEFWTEIIESVDPEHKLYWLAEGDEGGIANNWVRGEGGPFDSRYGWSYSEFLYKNENNRKEQTDARDFNKALFHLGYPTNRATFLTYIGSHDIFQGMEPLVSANTQDYIYGDNLKPVTVMTMLAPGVPMVYMGQEINYSKKGGVGIMTDTEAIDWDKVDEDYLSLVKTLIELRHTQPALNTLEGILLNHATDNDSVCVFERRAGKESVVGMVNLSYNPQTFKITSKVMPDNVYKDVFGGLTVNMGSQQSISLEPKGYAVFVKDDSDLKARTYKIRYKVPKKSKWTDVPYLEIYTPDPLKVGGDISILSKQKMQPVEGVKGEYYFEVPYLPEFGYYLKFTDSKSDQTEMIFVSTPGDYSN